MVFLGSLCRETAKNVITKKRREKTKGKKFFFLPTFSDFLQKVFVVFSSSSCRETAKNAIKKIDGKRRKEKSFFFSQLFRPKVFDMDFLQKVFYGVFELPLLRNAQKRHKKIKKLKKKSTYLPHLQSARYTSLSILFFFGAPRIRWPCSTFVHLPSHALHHDWRTGELVRFMPILYYPPWLRSAGGYGCSMHDSFEATM
jgi:hypothetical protein